MEIYLIRHTTPDVAKGICYGQTDIGVTESFEEETEMIRGCLPATVDVVYSSPLQRCSALAKRLFPDASLHLRDYLMEIDCGQWEMKAWDQLPKEEVDPWMADFVTTPIPGGESYVDLHRRVTGCWEEIVDGAAELRGMGAAGTVGAGAARMVGAEGMRAAGMVDAGGGAIAVVAHGGVIRSILCGLTGTALIDSFKTFSLHYGCVIRVYREEGSLMYTILSNPAPVEKEQHKPSSFYTRSSL